MQDIERMPSERDEQIYSAWEDGKGLRTLAREFGLSVAQIEQALDRMLPAFDSQNQLMAFKRALRQLEDLTSEFFAIAKRDKNHESAHLVARLNERICSMRGFSVVNIRMDPLAAQTAQAPSDYERIRAAIYAVARRQLPNSNGNGADASDDTAGPESSP